MTTERSSKSGYALAFLAGAVGGAVAAKRAPALLAKMQEHCRQMMEAGCCAPPSELKASSGCCEPRNEESGKTSDASQKAA